MTTTRSKPKKRLSWRAQAARERAKLTTLTAEISALQKLRAELVKDATSQGVKLGERAYEPQ